ncbi:hypothetical protein OC846_003991 [Tilletia horrida]|uniref:Intradiol ring-cleavage dioxygenases domain-containing protein n=1 Tax=Tilletia horrida TaxID=155126 RepID=A0AAN6JRI2_9BASI|nr:hypothetical protein OC846_003991 [Tilletia horrida]
MISASLSSTLLTGLAIVAGSARGSTIELRQDPVLSCKDPIHVSNLVLIRQDPSNIHQRAAFTHSVDAQGRLQLSTIAGNIPTPDYPQFHFRICNSTVMASTPVEVGQGVLRSYGLLSPHNHPNKCVTLAGPILSNVSSPFVSADCQTTDTVNLASQWWGVDIFDGATNVNILPVSFLGRSLNSTTQGVYAFESVVSGKDTLVQTRFTDRLSVYGLQLQTILGPG